MANRRLTASELEHANAILEQVRAQLDSVAAGDAALHWALRRKVYKELVYDERGKPMHRNTRLICADCDTSAQRDKGYA